MKTTKRIINILMVLILAVTVGAPVAFAAGGSNEPEEPVLVPLTERTVSQDGYQMKFKKDVLIQDPLNANSEPLDMMIQIKRNYRKIKWKLARKSDSVDGYIVLRKKGNSDKYKQIAIVGPKKKSYKDKKIKSRNNADYTVVGYRKTKYGIRISPCSGEGRAPGRRYQNPSKYVQIKNKIKKHGLSYYTSPVLVNKSSTKKDHINALIKTAYKYKGDRFVVCRSGRPGEGLDCSGLVMQACYGAGVDLWPVNPWRHRLARYEYESRNIANLDKLRTVRYKNRKRGDLIFFCNSRGVIIHVAIYLGNDRIIHATSVGNRVIVSGMGGGAYGKPCKVKRIFN